VSEYLAKAEQRSGALQVEEVLKERQFAMLAGETTKQNFDNVDDETRKRQRRR